MKWLLALLLTVLLLPLSISNAQDSTPIFEPVPCPFTAQPEFECGYLIVPEDHAQPEGRTIRLMVAIHHTTNPDPAPDPVIFLAGGPGSSAVGKMGTSLIEEAMLTRRDIIYLDQRGVGLSQPNLDCTELETLPFAPENAFPKMLKALKICRDRLTVQGIALENYTTLQSAADIAALRRVLGYEQWNVWGVSYGTRLALTMMRHYPEGIRSAILDSPFPPGINRFTEDADIANMAVENLFRLCAADTLCNLIYPDLDATFEQVIEALNQQPALLSMHDPETGERIAYALDGTNVAQGTARLAADSQVAVYLPALISDLSQQRYEQVIPIIEQLGMTLPRSGLSYSVLCSEELPYAMAGGQADDHSIAVCRNWFTGRTDTVENEPVQSDIPTLLLVGQIDGLTPPDWGRMAATYLPNSYFYELPGLGHVVMGDPCAVDITRSFLETPNSTPDTGCLDNMPNLHFVIPAHATRPYAKTSAGLFGIIACFGIIALLKNVRDYHDPLAMSQSLKLINFLPLLLSAGLILTLIPLGSYAAGNRLRLVEMIISLAVAVQTVFAFSLDNDPALELLLHCPRRIYWVLLERFSLILLPQTFVALVGSLLAIHVTGETEIVLTLLRWIPTTIMLTGIGCYVSMRTRNTTFAIAITLLFWFATAFMGRALLPGYQVISPLHYLQPFLWPFLPYATPADFSATDYLLNRSVVLLCGINLIMLALWQLRDEEQLLFGTPNRKEA